MNNPLYKKRADINYYKEPWIKHGIFYILIFILIASILFIFWSLNQKFSSSQVNNYPLKVEKKKNITANLLFYKGDIYLKGKNLENWDKINSSTNLHIGDSIKTGEDSWAYIEFSDGSFCRLDKNTELEIDNLSSDEIILNQITGQVFHFANKKKHSLLYKVIISNYELLALTNYFNTFNNRQSIILELFNDNLEILSNGTREIITGPALLRMNLINNKVEKAELTNDAIDTLFNYDWLVWNNQQNKLQNKDLIALDFLNKYPKEIKLKIKEKEHDEKDNDDNSIKFTWKYNEDFEGPLTYNLYLLIGNDENIEYPKNQYINIKAYDEEGNLVQEAEWPNLSAGKYYFRLAIVDDLGQVLKYSNVVKYILEENDSAKINLNAQALENNEIKFTWTAENLKNEIDEEVKEKWLLLISENDLPLYPQSSYQEIDLNQNTYTWTNLNAGKTYKFRLCEFLEEENKCRSYSNLITISIKADEEENEDADLNNNSSVDNQSSFSLDINATLTEDKEILITWGNLDPNLNYLLSITRAFAESKNVKINVADKQYLFKDTIEGKTYFISLCQVNENNLCVKRGNEIKITVN